MPLLPDALHLLACPVCQQPLALQQISGAAGAAVVRCRGCHRSFPMVDGLPVLLAEKGQLPPEET